MSCNNTNNVVQSFDRAVPAGETKLVGRVESGKWRFFVESDQAVKVLIRQNSTLSTFADKQIYIAANSAIEFQGSNSCKIFVLNESGATANISTYDAEYLPAGLEPIQFAEDGLNTAAAAAFGIIGTNNGYPQPYTNRLRIYAAANFRVRATDSNGNVVLNTGTQPVDESLFYELDCPQNLKWEIREDASSAGGIKYTAIWLRR
jgi:hypothetical protein